ncbi:MAG: hypothetical protein US11_C0002G0038 [Candidatus Roizmanbacteria bacterium GW2011_GWA2_36_23]|uniref:Glycosyltransferase RgtA/B/C/D-like domain-containing protein n=1 Tax=Candidatus Roizmanbacteria bacterium GW2011_GWA2_36_23 TaxID=1618480 RepID=A0A0G0GQ97_9BACT|nr:MAG: hypothetical protein US11_C0002G0038 [Candidatus Roizmanbacteria bacterium GW2011_GWA2_36_23]
MPKSNSKKKESIIPRKQFSVWKLLLKLSCLVLIIFSIYFASWFALHGDIVFHTDIARDFLLVEDIVKNKPITLIGPRSGGIPGVFHGPLWMYLNLPAFIMGGGNPAAVSWFWVLLYTVNVFIVYQVGKKIFNEEVGWISAALTSIVSAFSVPGMFNPFGAVMLAPMFLYFIFRYFKDNNWKDLVLALLMLGLMIQFQMAFAGPILILLLPILGFKIITNRKLLHIFSLLVILIPVSTFILFDLKHQFLQTRSVINYVSGKETTGQTDKPFDAVLRERVLSMKTDGIGFVTKGNIWLYYLTLAGFLYAVYKSWKNKQNDRLMIYGLFAYFYIGYWLMTTMYKGVMWGYYYWPFLTWVILIFASLSEHIDKRLFYPAVLVLAVFLLRSEVMANYKDPGYFGRDGSSWRFHYQAAKKIYDDAPSEFGYYIFTADQFGYSSRYAMNYTQNLFNNKKAYPYEKKKITYLLIAPSDNPTISDDWWKAEKVRVNSSPVKVMKFKDNNFRIEKYELSDKEIANKSDENLIHTLIFR